MKQTWKYTIRNIEVDGIVAYIPLTQGKFAVVDAADVPLVEGWNWCAMAPLTEDGSWYAYSSGKRKLRLHTYLMPAPDGFITDHKDRNGLNCRKNNLRVATYSQNSQNKKRPNIGDGKFKGVSKHGNKWRTRIKVGNKRFHIGSYESPELAARAYDTAAGRYFGEFAVLNFPFGSYVDEYPAITPSDTRRHLTSLIDGFGERLRTGSPAAGD